MTSEVAFRPPRCIPSAAARKILMDVWRTSDKFRFPRHRMTEPRVKEAVGRLRSLPSFGFFDALHGLVASRFSARVSPFTHNQVS